MTRKLLSLLTSITFFVGIWFAPPCGAQQPVSGTGSITIREEPPNETERANFELARRNIEKAMELAPDYYMAHEYYGLYHERMGNDDAALQSFKKSVKLTTYDGWPYSDLARELERTGKSAEAIDAFKTAIRMNPKNPYFHRNLGLIYWDKGRDAEAREEFDLARTLAQQRGIILEFPSSG